jgi:hypothetical protein
MATLKGPKATTTTATLTLKSKDGTWTTSLAYSKDEGLSSIINTIQDISGLNNEAMWSFKPRKAVVKKAKVAAKK